MQVIVQPRAEMRELLGSKPISIDRGELSHEGQDRSVSKATTRSAKLIAG
jgi:hypothetical protein